MKNLLKLFTCMALVFLFGCAEEQSVPTVENAKMKAIPSSTILDYMNGTVTFSNDNENHVTDRSASQQTTDVTDRYPSDPNNDIVGTSQLTRNSNKLTVNIHTDPIESLEGDAVTLWWIIFDVVEGSPVFYDAGFANGKVLGNNGKVNISASLKENDISSGLWLNGLGLADAENQGVHMIVRTHQDKIPSCMPAQIQTLCGGCLCELDNPCPGPNTCTDWLDAVHWP